MKVIRRLAPVLGCVLLAACTADGDFSGSGGINPGTGDGGGGDDCLLRVAGICVTGGPNTGLPNFRCTQTAGAGSTVTVTETGPLCALTSVLDPTLNTCDVLDPALAIDGNYDSAARAQYVIGALDPVLQGSQSLTVNLPDVVNAGQVAAFLVQYPGGTVDASVFRGLTVTTALAGAEQEVQFFDTVLDLDVLGLIGASSKILVGFSNTQPYNQLTLTVDALVATADVFNAVDVFEACINAVPIP